jgi:tetratricopeptide (TPR) repeat protein
MEQKNMTQRNLRSVLQALERELDAGDAQGAALGCQKVLEIFPRNLAAYRMLGKAYLLLGEYPQAADIFLRLLSAEPDDITAHLGLALLREQEDKLEAALWHCQRAGEVQPASQVLKDETARLLRLRQPAAEAGGQPRATTSLPDPTGLSRAALARLYLQGGCYPQASAELEAAIAEQPERNDLLPLLSEAYAQAGQREQALQAGQAALQKLPFSLVANRVAFQSLVQMGEAEQAQPYRQRLQDLDPYWATVTPEVPHALRVPDEAVMIDI